MAYINVAEWSPDQVTDWLKGLDNSMYHYVQSFSNNEVTGQQLLNIRPYELDQLGMYSIGHQEIVLEAVELLRNFHYHLDKENLQFLALHIATASQCLHNQLARHADKSKIETQILSDVTRTIATIKPLISWLDRAPFHRINRFVELRNKMLRFAFEMATMAQRDRFVQNPVDQIMQTALRVAKLANYIIQDVSDVMILQPATLNLVTLKKKESELGFNIVPSYHGIHVVTDIKYNSPVHTSGKIEDGDEIVQINYQTVVGWQFKKVQRQLNESPPDILLTLKKRPKHSKIYGQIYMKPYRLPSKKKAAPAYRWGGGEPLPSPRVADMLPLMPLPPPSATHDIVALASPPLCVPDARQSVSTIEATTIHTIGGSVAKAVSSLLASSSSSSSGASTSNGLRATATTVTPATGNSIGVDSIATVPRIAANVSDSDDEDDDDDDMTPTVRNVSNKDLRIYLSKGRTVLQRRHSICGDRVSGFKNNNMHVWPEYRDGDADSPSLRDKSVSFGFGLETTAAASTATVVVGGSVVATKPMLTNSATGAIVGGASGVRFSDFGAGMNCSLPDIGATEKAATASSLSSSAKPQGISKVVRFDSSRKCDEYKDNRYACNVDSTRLEVFEPIPYADDEESEPTTPLAVVPPTNGGNATDASLTQAVNEVLVRREIEKWEQKTGGAIKGGQEIDLPPAIEPRNDFLHKTPPAPPPRPRKLSTIPASPPSTTTSPPALFSSASFHTKTHPPQHHHFAHSSPNAAVHQPPVPLPSTLPKPSPRHLHISEPIRVEPTATLNQKHPQQQPAINQLYNNQHNHHHQHHQHYNTHPQPVISAIAPQPIYNSQQQLQLSESFLQPDPNNDLAEYNNMPSMSSTMRSRATDDSIVSAVSTAAGDASLSTATDGADVESLELVTPHKTKNLTLKKKNSILAKRRNITLKTLEVSDIQGHLYRRTKDKHGVTYWAKLYMVLTDTALYGFRSKDSEKADCLIFLDGFTVSLANEVHSKPFAFKVYHPSKTFYFAAESQMALAQWIEYIRKATLRGSNGALGGGYTTSSSLAMSCVGGGSDSNKDSQQLQPVNMRELFSEAESSDGEMDFGQVHKMLGTPSPISISSRFGHKKSFCGSNASNLNATDESSAERPPKEKYHLGFGSLKKFSWSSSSSKAAKAEKAEKARLAGIVGGGGSGGGSGGSSGDVPVPTAQFRSYRKVPGNAGLQLGTNSMISSSPTSTPSSFVAGPSVLSNASAVDAAAVDFAPSSQPSTSSSSTRSMPQASTNNNVASASAIDASTPPAATQQPQQPTTPPTHQSTPLRSSRHIETFNGCTDADIDASLSAVCEDDDFAVQEKNHQQQHSLAKMKKTRKNAPYHYIHASNPNLVEFDFPTAKTLDYSFPKVNGTSAVNGGWETTLASNNGLNLHHHHHHLHHHHMQHQHSNSLQGFVTLKDLMLQKQEDDSKEMYNNRVTLGVEKKLDPNKPKAMQLKLLQQQQQQKPQQQKPQQQQRADDANSIAGSTASGGTYNKIQNRSLPKTPDYAQSFKPDDRDIIMTRSREGQKLRDFGYEFISGDDAAGSASKKASSSSRSLQQAAAASSVTVGTAAVVPSTATGSKKKSGLNWIGASLERRHAAAAAADDDQRAMSPASSASSSRGGSVKKSKGKLMGDALDTFKTSSEKLFQFKTHQNQPMLSPTPEKPLHKPSYLPLTLPLNKAYRQPQQATHVYNMHGQSSLVSPSAASSSSTFTDDSTGSSFRKTTGGSTDASSSSIFGKLSFGSGGSSSSSGGGIGGNSMGSGGKTAKEKKLLGSPRLHRALFGQNSGGKGRRESDVHSLDHEPFMPMEPKPRAIVHEHDEADIAPSQLPPPTPLRSVPPTSMPVSPDYPHLEYPPVFEAETYSLNDPNASLTLLRRRNNPNNRSK